MAEYLFVGGLMFFTIIVVIIAAVRCNSVRKKLLEGKKNVEECLRAIEEDEKAKFDKQKQLREQQFQIDCARKQEEFNTRFELESKAKLATISNLDQQISMMKSNFEQRQEELDKQRVLMSSISETRLEEYKEHRLEVIDEQVRAYKQKNLTSVQNQIEEEKRKAQAAREALCQELDKYEQDRRQILTEELENLTAQVEDYREKQRLINEALLRERAVKEQQDFYRVKLSPEEKEDIQNLTAFLPKIHNSSALYKIVYDLFVSRAVKEMEKRVLNNESFSGIYKITGPDGRIYIGKSTDIKSRWQQHCKSAFHTGTISWAAIHDEMEKVGIDQFTFEVVERTPKENLTDREKFWIRFYDSDKTGFNMRNG